MTVTNTPADVEQLRDTIAEWKQAHGKRSRMPVEIWTDAIRVANEVGAYAASRALGVSYDALKRRMEKPGGEEFVELDAREVLASTGNVVLELSRRDGSRLTLRLAGNQPLDVDALVGAFCGRRK